MNYLNGIYYVEVKDKRHIFDLKERFILRELQQPNYLGTHYQIFNGTNSRKKEKVIENLYNEMEVKFYPKEETNIVEKPKLGVERSWCNVQSLIESDERNHCKTCHFNNNKRKHQLDEKVFRQNRNLFTSLPYANENIKEIHFSLIKRLYESTKKMADNLKHSQGLENKKFKQECSNIHDEMNCSRQNGQFMFEKKPLKKGAGGVALIMHWVLIMLKFFKRKPQIKNRKRTYYLYYNYKLSLADDGGENWGFNKIISSFFPKKWRRKT